MLVNKFKSLDKTDIPINLIKVNSLYKENIMLENTTYNQFLKLRDKVLEKNYQIEIESGYRDYDYQNGIYEKLIEEKGYDYANKFIAKPGCSEHQTGLCLDFCLWKDNKFLIEHELKELDIIDYIHNILCNYGFILRYPKGKENITGYGYEPWHIRYVGLDLAKYLYQENITLDEYFTQ